MFIKTNYRFPRAFEQAQKKIQYALCNLKKIHVSVSMVIWYNLMSDYSTVVVVQNAFLVIYLLIVDLDSLILPPLLF